MIAIDATPVVPENNILMGKGACIKVSDGSGVCNQFLIKAFSDYARTHSIPYQLEVNDLGFNESAFPPLVSDAKSIALSYPLEAMHTAKSKVSLADINCLEHLIVFFKYL
jgi:putative aminopeptidase FrvX